MSCGSKFTCAIKKGAKGLTCWGHNMHGVSEVRPGSGAATLAMCMLRLAVALALALAVALALAPAP